MFASPQILLDYFARLGMLTHTWALVETGLDNITHIIFDKLDGKIIYRKKPRVLDLKLKYLRAWHEQIPELQSRRLRALDLIDRIERFSIDRHIYIHGFATADFDSKLNYTITKIEPDPALHQTVTRASDLNEFMRLIDAANDLCTEVALYNRELLIAFVFPNNDNQPAG